MREFCIKSGKKESIAGMADRHGWLCSPLPPGVQLYLREYDFSSSTPFTDDDIISLVPVVKHTNFRVCVLLERMVCV